ncbi:hypothetical protein WN72_46560 [Bradyrhizobium arachidis]|uniref:Uncharacterized protein n=1 Tax=Bradyrhizobium arachidis TaxID=858423 RepID=A0AAE7TM00_9BRAD|nr:hypothetical protein WN72_46560 [Bradyrhizobium arachidis]
MGRRRLATPGVIPREGGESSTPRPLRISRTSVEYWIARSSRAMTAVGRAAPRRIKIFQILPSTQ